jgi:hypothetical protein
MKLYHVTTTANEYSGCKNVKFIWFHCDRAEPRPYAELIQNYDPNDKDAAYPESAIDELFKANEAAALKEYLDRNHGDDGVTTIEAADLPVAKNTMGVRGIPVGGSDGHYMLDKSPDYCLPFRVWGYFNLLGCELADRSGETFRAPLLMFDGQKLRRETQEEARQRSVELRTR